MTPSAVEFLLEWATSVDVPKEIRVQFVKAYQEMSSTLIADGIQRVFTVDDIKDIIEHILEHDETRTI